MNVGRVERSGSVRRGEVRVRGTKSQSRINHMTQSDRTFFHLEIALAIHLDYFID